MSDRLREWAVWIVLALGIAAITHFTAMGMVPHYVMGRLLSNLGAPNRIYHDMRVDASVQGVVRPSPDLLYSACPYELSAGPLRVRSPVPPGTYWSVALYDNDTNNFYTLNDVQVHAKNSSVVDFVIEQDEPGQDQAAALESMPIVRSPSQKGLVLFRTVISSEKDFAYIDALRRQATCATFHASIGDVSSKGG